MSIISELIVRDETSYKPVKIQAIYYRDLVEHPGNDIYKQSEIESLAKNIEQIGLLEPLVVEPLGNGYYQIVSGHRRYNAYRFLVECEGKDQFEDIPCRVLTFDAPLQQQIALFASNAQRQFEGDDKQKIIDRAGELYDQLVREGQKPAGRKRDWIADITGFSGRTVQNYFGNHKELMAEADSNALTKKEKKAMPINVVKTLQSFQKKLEKIEEELLEIDEEVHYLTDVYNSIGKAIVAYKTERSERQQ